MLKRTVTAIVGACALSLVLSGCIVHTRDRAPRRSHQHVKAKKGRDCRPSHYWDGHKCRHKGKGKGARKHDY